MKKYISVILFLVASMIPLLGHALCFHSADEVAVYYDSNLNGSCTVLNVGYYPNANSIGLPNDSISSIAVGSNVRAVLFEHNGYRGQEALFEGGYNYSNVNVNVNDETSSIIVEYRQDTHVAYWYEGNYPHNRETFWTQEMQGIAHDKNYWYITQKSKLRKFHITADLSRDDDILNVDIPAALAQRGCDHFGDPDVKNGYIFVPVEGCMNKSILMLAIFSTTDLHLVAYDELYRNPIDNNGNGAAWLAINPANGYLYTSGTTIDSNHPLIVYSIDWSAIYDDPNPHWIIYEKLFNQHLYRRDGTYANIGIPQGGVFSDDGKLLYLSNGGASCSGAGDGSGLRVFDTYNRKMIARSGNNYGPFNYENHCGFPKYEEPEGLDYVNMNGRGGQFGGFLHAILLDNDGHDAVFIKHYNK